MYDAMFATGLRLPLMALHCQLANFLGLFVSHIAPNAWRIFIGAGILWGCLSGGNRKLSLDEFLFISIDLNTSSRPKEYTTSLH